MFSIVAYPVYDDETKRCTISGRWTLLLLLGCLQSTGKTKQNVQNWSHEIVSRVLRFLTVWRARRAARVGGSCSEPVERKEFQFVCRNCFGKNGSDEDEPAKDQKDSNKQKKLTQPRLCCTPMARHSLSVIKWLLGTKRARSFGNITWLKREKMELKIWNNDRLTCFPNISLSAT